VAHTYNPNYSGGKDQEDGGSKPAWTYSCQDTVSKIPNTKRADRVAQVVEYLPSKCEALSSNSNITQRTNPLSILKFFKIFKSVDIKILTLHGDGFCV
jgi:hypothetical protein